MWVQPRKYIAGDRFKLVGRGASNANYRSFWAGGTAYTFLTSGGKMTLSSLSNNDSAAGTGCRSARVTYIDTNFAEQSVELTLAGQSGVQVGSDVLYPSKIEGLTFGSERSISSSGNLYVGTGSLTIGIPAVTHQQATGGYTESHSAIGIVPAGETWAIESIHCFTKESVSQSGWDLVLDVEIDGVKTRQQLPNFTNTLHLFLPLPNPIVLTERSKFNFQFRRSAGADIATIVADIVRLGKDALSF